MRFDLRRDRNSTVLRLALAAMAVALLAGCANRDSVTRGALSGD